MRIKVLEPHIANQIAAGEVIQRPASVVKEVLENALDAGAKVISLEIEQSGSKLIRIRDDGYGISKHDLPLAIKQHATSKLSEIDDLNHLSSLGFRGEALASISSVAELTILSHAQDEEHAWQINAENELSTVAHPIGTTVEVRNLFANIPVRRKFLKSARTEFAHIEEVVKRIALSAYETKFHLTHNGKQLFNLPAIHDSDNRHLRLNKLLNKSFAKHSIIVDAEQDNMQLSGWILPNEYARAHADQQYFFVNGRVVKDRLIQHAIRLAYQELYQQAHFPAYVLYLQCSSEKVDVNVHPTKHEVRFSEPRMVHDFIVSVLLKAQSKIQLSLPSAEVVTKLPQNKEHKIAEANADYKIGKQWQAIVLLAQQFILVKSTDMHMLIQYRNAQYFLFRNALQTNNVKAQPLLMPQIIHYDANTTDLIIAKHQKWLDYGIELQQSGADCIMLRQLPQCLHGIELKPLFQSLSKLEQTNQIVDCIVEHSLIKTELSMSEMQLLCQQLAEYDLAILKQEKIVIELSTQRIESLFK